MGNTSVVVGKIVAMFLVMLVGVLARRRSLVDAKTTSILSRLTTDLALPALIFTQMLATVDAQALRESWGAPVLTIAVLFLGQLIGWAGWRLFATRAQAPTFIFVVAMANWIYLPLPIVEALYGKEGIRIILLCNAGAMVFLWTVGVATLHGGRLDRAALFNLVKNPGLIATVLGIALALLGPHVDVSAGVKAGLRPGLEALAMIGQLTIPLSLLVTGMQLGAMATFGAHVPVRALAGVTVLRLVVVPLVAAGLAWGMQRCGCSVPDLVLAVCFLIATMPVGVSCSILAERFRQDGALAAQSILYTTLLSIVTVPAMVWVFHKATMN